MSKKNALTPQAVQTIINDYLQVLRLVYGDNRADQTELTYKKGWFYLRPPGRPRDVMGIPYRPYEIKELTADLCRKIPQRMDSDDDGYE